MNITPRRKTYMNLPKMLERKLETAFRKCDWLMVCAAARVLITLSEGPGMEPLPKGTAFRWR